MTDDPHGEQPVERAGADLADASAATVLVHGRGARARGMLDLAGEIRREDTTAAGNREDGPAAGNREDTTAAGNREDVAFLAPQASRGTWYPESFLAPIESNEPHLTSALGKIESVVETVTDEVPRERTILLGFSQGACLATEYAARNADRYGGVVAFSGGLIGPEGTPRDYEGSMDGTPVFFGCSDRDPHIPVERVHESADAFEELGADVTERIYEGMGHGINEDELDYVRGMVADLVE